jgi:hypothetical protein
LCFSFFLSPSPAATYIFTAPTCTATIISLEACALYAEFQDFIPRFNKILLESKASNGHAERGGYGEPATRYHTGTLSLSSEGS